MNAITTKAYQAIEQLDRLPYSESHKWHMHPATAARVLAEADREALTFMSDEEGGVKFMGIPIERDQTIPEGLMRLLHMSEVQLDQDLQV